MANWADTLDIDMGIDSGMAVSINCGLWATIWGTMFRDYIGVKTSPSSLAEHHLSAVGQGAGDASPLSRRRSWRAFCHMSHGQQSHTKDPM